MPFIVSHLVDEDFDSKLLELLFWLSKLNEYMLADKFSHADVEDFQHLIIEYCGIKCICKETFPAFKKNVLRHHILEHYSQ
jgi:hypothetical protein